MATSKIHKTGWSYTNLGTTVDWINGGAWTAPSDGILTIIVITSAGSPGPALRMRNDTASDTVMTCVTAQFGTGNPSFVGSFPVRAGQTYMATNVASTVASVLARYYALL